MPATASTARTRKAADPMTTALQSIRDEQNRHEQRDEERERRTDHRLTAVEDGLADLKVVLSDGLTEINKTVKMLTDAKSDAESYARGMAAASAPKRSNPWIIGLVCALAPVLLLSGFAVIDYAAHYYIWQTQHASSSVTTSTATVIERPHAR